MTYDANGNLTTKQNIGAPSDTTAFQWDEKTTKGEEDPQGVRPTLFRDGIFVKKAGKKIAQYRCDNNAGISAVVYDVLPTEPFKQIIPISGKNGKVIDVTFGWIRNNDDIVRLTTAIPTKNDFKIF